MAAQRDAHIHRTSSARPCFRRIVRNLKGIGLRTDRIRPRYESIGLLQYESGRAATELTAKDLLDEGN